MIKVKSRGNETAEQMIRRFKKVCEKEGLTKDIKRVAYYEKPSEKRRRRQRKGGPRVKNPTPQIVRYRWADVCAWLDQNAKQPSQT